MICNISYKSWVKFFLHMNAVPLFVFHKSVGSCNLFKVSFLSWKVIFAKSTMPSQETPSCLCMSTWSIKICLPQTCALTCPSFVSSHVCKNSFNMCFLGADHLMLKSPPKSTCFIHCYSSFRFCVHLYPLQHLLNLFNFRFQFLLDKFHKFNIFFCMFLPFLLHCCETRLWVLWKHCRNLFCSKNLLEEISSEPTNGSCSFSTSTFAYSKTLWDDSIVVG